MGKKKASRKAASKQPRKKRDGLEIGQLPKRSQQLLREIIGPVRVPNEKALEQECKVTEAKCLINRRYWDEKNATINDALSEVCFDAYTASTILESIAWSLYNTHLDGYSGGLSEKLQTKVLVGIHLNLQVLASSLARTVNRADNVYTDHLPAKKKEGVR